jgi:hypothetical protein
LPKSDGLPGTRQESDHTLNPATAASDFCRSCPDKAFCPLQTSTRLRRIPITNAARDPPALPSRRTGPFPPQPSPDGPPIAKPPGASPEGCGFRAYRNLERGPG